MAASKRSFPVASRLVGLFGPAGLVTVGLISIGLVAGCTLEPTYHRPALPTAPAWPTGPAFAPPKSAAQPAQGAVKSPAESVKTPNSAEAANPRTLPSTAPLPPADEIGWRDFFTDPQLQKLIELALKNNRNLRESILNVASAEAQFRVQRAQLFPFLDLTGLGEGQRYPAGGVGVSGGTASASGTNANAAGSAGSISGTSPTATGASSSGGAAASTGTLTSTGTTSHGSIVHYYSAGIGFSSYELDLFGRVRSLTRQAFESYLNVAETRRSAQLTLVAQVATDYLTLLADQEQLKLARDTLDAQQKSYNLTLALFQAGTTTALSLRQAETTVDTARANVAQFTRQAAQDIDALVLVIGTPGQPDLPPAHKFDDQRLLEALPAGLPSELLTRRPDILAAEHSLLSANANIGAARAAFFPTIALTASYGTASTNLTNLFQGATRTWTFVPSLNLPIFTGGQNRANLDLAKIEKDIYIARYEQTIHTAFQEVADALAARGTLDDQIAATQALVDADAATYQLSEMRFRAGVDTFLSALDAQRALFSAQQQLITIKQSRLNNLVTLYKALGGGWNERTLTQTATAAK